LKIQASEIKVGMQNPAGFIVTEITKETNASIWIKWGNSTPKMYRKSTMVEIVDEETKDEKQNYGY